MVEDRVRIGLTESGNSLASGKHRGEPLCATFAPKVDQLTIFFIVKHWHLTFASRTPESLHRESAHSSCLGRVACRKDKAKARVEGRMSVSCGGQVVPAYDRTIRTRKR